MSIANAYFASIRERNQVLQATAAFGALFGAGLHFTTWTDLFVNGAPFGARGLALLALTAMLLLFGLGLWIRPDWSVPHTLASLVLGALGVLVGVQSGQAVGVVQACLGGLLVGAAMAGLPSPWLAPSQTQQESSLSPIR